MSGEEDTQLAGDRNATVAPKVSVIVPVYNAEDYLHRCMDSLVYQTMEEIEILIVDNQSTDGTWEIIEDYRDHFPEKVRAFSLEVHTNGPGAGRNVGLANARAEFIGFADSDDYFEYDAFEKMYKKAFEDKCDLVYVASYDVKGTNFKITRNLPKGTREEILTIGSMVFWNKLVHRSLFDIVGKVPEDMVFEDLAYCPGLVSRALKIGYIGEPLYYYIIREDSGVNTMDPNRVLKSLEAENIAISLCNPEYIDYFMDSVAMRICNDIRDRWQFADSYVEQLHKLKPYLENNYYLKKDKRNYARVQKYYSISEECIPRILYLNDFGDYSNGGRVESLKENAFWNDCEIVLLNEDNCDVTSIPSLKDAYDSKDYEVLAQYYALKRMYEDGGIYIDPCIEIDNPLNFVLHLNIFWAYIDKNSFSDKIFGSVKQNSVISALLGTYESAQNFETYESLAERMREVYVVNYGLHLDGKTIIYDNPISVFGPEVFTINNGANIHMACHNFCEKAGIEDFITVRRSTLLEK